ncbi:hypothetical protein [Bosea sp. (in: a-proteobacteria)]|uniref:hypothetical protein n=1 Tax=Bosea sp. (in: a-proteobacteria) TaxID=1871050 RepID=UPI002B49DDCD|nr:hypothetical protein [Bosea sp. (in: a-proteobacteria)]WRH59314.1 MAG: hypothetical protein RSE11_05905 [Bosea sp. (in: a-proteobacteria)]
MSSVSQFFYSSSPKAVAAGLPGSNGYWRRDVYRVPGTYTWTAQKSGRVRIQAIGAAAGGSGSYPGASGSFGEKTLTVSAGQTLTVVLGAGGAGSVAGTTSGNGGNTSISGTPVGGTALGLTGALGAKQDAPATFGTAGAATGPWDLSFEGAVALSASRGSSASASPFGAGVSNSAGTGGAGWGGPTVSSGGASTHSRGGPGINGAPGLTAKAGTYSEAPNTMALNGEAGPFWDLRDVDSGGGSVGPGSTNYAGGIGGPGAGGGGAGAASASGGPSILGGGTGNSSGSSAAPKSGHGAGGGANSGQTGGDGGDAFVMIFWDEAQ